MFFSKIEPLYSKEFSNATGVTYYWGHQKQEDGVYYIGVNLFPSKDPEMHGWRVTMLRLELQSLMQKC